MRMGGNIAETRRMFIALRATRSRRRPRPRRRGTGATTARGRAAPRAARCGPGRARRGHARGRPPRARRKTVATARATTGASPRGSRAARRGTTCASGHAESPLGPAQDRLRQEILDGAPQDDLARPAQLVAAGQARGELDQRMVQERRARLQAVGHGRDVDLGQEVAGQVRHRVRVERAPEQVRRVGGREDVEERRVGVRRARCAAASRASTGRPPLPARKRSPCARSSSPGSWTRP